MSPVLRADCVSYATQGRTLLRKVALDLHSGEVLAVVGPNGAGKSTLCGVLAGDIAPTEGVIEVCGLPLRATKTTTLARLRSMLIQNTHMRFPFTAREVTLMGRYPYLSRWRSPTEADFAIVEGAMQNTEVLHLAERVYPTLSGGRAATGFAGACPCPGHSRDLAGRAHDCLGYRPSAVGYVAVQKTRL